MTAEEYAIEHLMKLEKENDSLRCSIKRLEENCVFLRDRGNSFLHKLEQVKQIIISTLDHEPDLSSDIMLYNDDAQELISILDIKIDKEVSDEVPED